MRIFVHVREKIISVQCGEGSQEVIWLANAAMTHYDKTMGKRFGPPTAIRKEGGVVCDPTAQIRAVLKEDQHVFAELVDGITG